MTAGMASAGKAQRLILGETLVELGSADERIVVLDADVSSSTQTCLFARAFPKRFFNFGITEANMVSAAAGMSTCGLIPVVSTFALFLSLRAGDQVRSQVAGAGLNVKLIGGYAGLSDFADGASHQSVEDLAIMRVMPGMTVIAPGSANETRDAVRAAIEHVGPVFLRISREVVPDDSPLTGPFRIGVARPVCQGTDVALVTTGTMLPTVLAAWAHMQAEGLSVGVLHVPTLKPLDEPALVAAARMAGAVVTVEEHSIIGGLGSAVCETLAQFRPTPVIRCGIPDQFGESGGYAEILQRAGLDWSSIVRCAKRVIAMKKEMNS